LLTEQAGGRPKSKYGEKPETGNQKSEREDHNSKTSYRVTPYPLLGVRKEVDWKLKKGKPTSTVFCYCTFLQLGKKRGGETIEKLKKGDNCLPLQRIN